MSEVSNDNKMNNKPGENKLIMGQFLPPSISVNVNPSKDENDSNFDERSKKGQFGWFTLGNVHVPYIYRNDEQYCSVRMVELSALNSFLRFLNKDIYNCTNIRSYYVTPAEASLLNQINFLHCDSQYGRDQFTVKDLVVKVNDAEEFYQFLGACYSKLLNGKTEGDSRLGFVIINKESVVPYTISDSRLGFVIINKESVVPYTISKGQKYVPLFYFEGEIDQLKLKSYKLEGWDLCYLKFCCKIQGIRNQLFAHDTCSVINLDDIKIYFPPETTFEEYWPTKTVDVQMLLSNKSQTPMGFEEYWPTKTVDVQMLLSNKSQTPMASTSTASSTPPIYPPPQPQPPPPRAPAQIIYKYNTPYPTAAPHRAQGIRTYPAVTTAAAGQNTMYNYMNLA
ncbi:hypothetical protein QE152_g4389 [Popillia japonica]|uniref:Uncharacterized protein n=1 Tax=Popillia japonica TaxID=7064 RepID=A0AAW1N0R7_POPJA